MSVRRIPRSIFDTLGRPSTSNYICRQCRQILRPQQEVSQQQRYASTALSNDGQSRQRVTARKNKFVALSQSGLARRTAASVAETDVDDFDEPEPVDTNARTWEGLPVIGHNGDWRDMPEKVQDDYKSWHNTAPPMLSHQHLTAFLFQAIVECHTCSDLSTAQKLASRAHTRSILLPNQLETATIALSPQHTIEGIKHSSAKSGSSQVQTQSSLYLPSPEQQSFLDAQIKPTNPMTFTILKRFSSLIGRRIPDPLLTTLAQNQANTYRHFITALTEHLAPKPANVVEKLAMDRTLASQSNVLVFPRRETPVDREKEVGRWKVIEEELTKRGLPVLGRIKLQQ